MGDHSVVRRMEGAGGQRFGPSGRQIGVDGNVPGAFGVSNLDRCADPFDPRGAHGPGDAGDHDRRTPIGRGALHDARATRSCLEVHDESIVGVRGARAERSQRQAHTRDLAERHPQLVDHLGAVSAEPTAAGARVGPPGRDLGIGSGEHRNLQHDGGEPRLADRARADRAGERRLAGIPPELRAHHVDDAGLARRREHRSPVGRIARERLLTDHVLAGCDRGQGELRVRVRRSGDRHRVDATERERGGEVGERDRNVEKTGALLRALGITPHDRLHIDSGAAQRAHVRDAAETGSDDDRAELALVHVPRGVMPAAR